MSWIASKEGSTAFMGKHISCLGFASIGSCGQKSVESWVSVHANLGIHEKLGIASMESWVMFLTVSGELGIFSIKKLGHVFSLDITLLQHQQSWVSVHANLGIHGSYSLRGKLGYVLNSLGSVARRAIVHANLGIHGELGVESVKSWAMFFIISGELCISSIHRS